MKSFKGILPAIVVNQGAYAVLNRCEVKGTSSKNQDAKTIGVLVKQGELLIKDSKVHNQTYGGILVQGGPAQNTKIFQTKILQNKKVKRLSELGRSESTWWAQTRCR